MSKNVAPLVSPATLVANAIYTGFAGGSSPPIDTTGASLIAVSISYDDSSSGVEIIDNTYGNTLILISQEGAGNNVRLYYIPDPVVGPNHTFTPNNASFITMCIAAFSNIPTSSPLQTSAPGNNTTSAGIQPGEIAPIVGDELFITAYESVRGGEISIDSGFVITDSMFEQSGANLAGGLAYKISSDPENPTWNTTGLADQEACVMSSFFTLASTPPTQPSGRPPLAPSLLANGWLAGTPVPFSCSVGVSPDFYDTGTRTLYSCVNGRYVIAAPPANAADLIKQGFIGLPVFANNTAAKAGGLKQGEPYRTNGDPATVCVVK
jgi:hypothetical protein